MSRDPNVVTTPIVCNMTDARDTAEERMAEYGRLFAQSLTGRERTGRERTGRERTGRERTAQERTGHGVRLRFRADDGVEAWVRDLAAREKACCPFYDFAVSVTGGEVWWDIGLIDGVADDDEGMARRMLDEFYDAPDNVAGGVAGMKERLADSGIAVTTNEAGTIMQFDRTGAGT